MQNIKSGLMHERYFIVFSVLKKLCMGLINVHCTRHCMLEHLHLQDVDECTNNNGGCEQLCSNTIGSFLCDCGTGYLLDRNGLNCNGKLCVFLAS